MDLLQTTTLNPPTNLYDRIVLNHSICMLLWQIGASDILSHKLDEPGPDKSVALCYHINPQRLPTSMRH